MSPLALSVGLVIELHNFPVFLQSLRVTMQIPIARDTFTTSAPFSPFLIYLTCLLQKVILTTETFALQPCVATDGTARSGLLTPPIKILLLRLHPALHVCCYP